MKHSFGLLYWAEKVGLSLCKLELTGSLPSIEDSQWLIQQCKRGIILALQWGGKEIITVSPLQALHTSLIGASPEEQEDVPWSIKWHRLPQCRKYSWVSLAAVYVLAIWEVPVAGQFWHISFGSIECPITAGSWVPVLDPPYKQFDHVLWFTPSHQLNTTQPLGHFFPIPKGWGGELKKQ